MRKIITLLAALVITMLGLSAPAQADTASLPYGASATLTVPDVTLPQSGCVNVYGTFTMNHSDYWNADIAYSGPTSYPVSDYLYGTGPSSQILSFYMCASSDGPGVYTATALVTVEDPSSYNQLQGFVTDQFTVSHYTPPPAPPAPPAPPVYTDVTGSVAKRALATGVKFIFRSDATPAGTLTGSPLKWKVSYDGKNKRVAQGPSEKDVVALRFASGTGRHVIKVYRNGVKVLRTVVNRG